MNHLSYPSTGSIAYPLRHGRRVEVDQAMLAIVIAEVHPGNWQALPPSPKEIACKGEAMGLAKYGEFIRTTYF